MISYELLFIVEQIEKTVLVSVAMICITWFVAKGLELRSKEKRESSHD